MSSKFNFKHYQKEIDKAVRHATDISEFIISEIEFHYYSSVFLANIKIKEYVNTYFNLKFDFSVEFGIKINTLREQLFQQFPQLVGNSRAKDLEKIFTLERFSCSKLHRAYQDIFKVKEICINLGKQKLKRGGEYIFPTLTLKAEKKEIDSKIEAATSTTSCTNVNVDHNSRMDALLKRKQELEKEHQEVLKSIEEELKKENMSAQPNSEITEMPSHIGEVYQQEHNNQVNTNENLLVEETKNDEFTHSGEQAASNISVPNPDAYIDYDDIEFADEVSLKQFMTDSQYL